VKRELSLFCHFNGFFERIYNVLKFNRNFWGLTHYWFFYIKKLLNVAFFSTKSVVYVNYHIFSLTTDLLYNRTISLKRDRDQSFSSDTFSFNFVHHYRTTWCNKGKGRIVIHNPNDPPTIGDSYQKSTSFFSLKDLTQVKIIPIITSTSDEVRDLDVEL
jgi:hypothetical protein